MKLTVYHTTCVSYDEALCVHLNTDDRIRADGISNVQRRQAFILGRAMLRLAVRDLLGESDYRLHYNALGRPDLLLPDGAHPWSVNLSHSGVHIFLAIQSGATVGIDSEQILPRQIKRLSEKLFTPSEQAYIQRADDELSAFYHLWTRYEAQIKFAGKSVFSELPTMDLWLNTYCYQDSIFSLCTQSAPTDIIFLSRNFLPQTTTVAFYPKQLAILL